MPDLLPSSGLPPIPEKRYFTIGEVSELCGVKPHVLRYWEQEFTQLKPLKRRGNRRYYQHHEVMLVRHIRELLYEQGFTINGARNKLDQEKSFDSVFGGLLPMGGGAMEDDALSNSVTVAPTTVAPTVVSSALSPAMERAPITLPVDFDVAFLKREMTAILALLRGPSV
jgi:DNA-binding transcriptional MerR regulator